MGHGNDRESRVAHRKAIRWTNGYFEARATRFATILRSALPQRRWRMGADTILTWARFGADNREIFGLQTTIPGGRERRDWNRAQPVNRAGISLNKPEY
jgi:hypothetical protein